MSEIKTVEGKRVLKQSAAIAVIVGRFNGFIVEQLENACLDMLARHGVASGDITVVRVPGAFEMPVVAGRLAASGSFEAVIALGAVIRGGTPHFDYVAGNCIGGLADCARTTGVPVVCGVLTTDTIEQAIERAGTKAGNKGGDAAVTAIEMISVMRQL